MEITEALYILVLHIWLLDLWKTISRWFVRTMGLCCCVCEKLLGRGSLWPFFAFIHITAAARWLKIKKKKKHVFLLKARCCVVAACDRLMNHYTTKVEWNWNSRWMNLWMKTFFRRLRVSDVNEWGDFIVERFAISAAWVKMSQLDTVTF